MTSLYPLLLLIAQNSIMLVSAANRIFLSRPRRPRTFTKKYESRRWIHLICSLFLVPSRPLKVIFKAVTNSSVTVHWQQPTTPNGIVVGYRIYYMHDNFTDVQTVRHTEPNMFHLLKGLSTYLFKYLCIFRFCRSKGFNLVLLKYQAENVSFYAV